MHLVQTIFKSEKEKTKIERLHIPNSKKYIMFLQKKDSANLLYSQSLESINESELNRSQKEIVTAYKGSNNLIKAYSQKHLEYADQIEELKKGGFKDLIQEFKWGIN